MLYSLLFSERWPRRHCPALRRPHSVCITPDQKRLVVLDYFIEQGNIVLLSTPADDQLLFIARDPESKIRRTGSKQFHHRVCEYRRWQAAFFGHCRLN
ncbi:hypothetical protein BDZ91DRAFT_314836 [Kalaharituber pfeilii]|nr:hypothetical protein BDZ91DRAFT_314836 [Kalaharituber pfeilii]